MKLHLLLFLLLFAFSPASFAEGEDSPDDASGAVEEVPSPPAEAEPPKIAEDLVPAKDSAVSDLLNIGVRIDPGLTIGSPVQQGFVLNSVRLSIFGATDMFDYRLSLGQTREFASALIPQITPVEAYLRANGFREPGEFDHFRLQLKFGMFTPSFHPYWSPDLSDIDVNDYSSAHRNVFIGRDLGAELKYESKATGTTAGMGAFNGSGITSINSNNTKAFTLFFRQEMGGEQSSFALGASAYWLGQSSRGGVNFKNNMLGLGYSEISLLHSRLKVALEVFGGSFEDSTRKLNSTGGALWAWFEILKGTRLFARMETLSSSPVGNSLGFDHLVVGPIFDLSQSVKLFSHFDTIKYEDGTTENQVLLRLRLNL